MNFAGQGSAICVAENEQIGTGIPRGAECLQGILGIVLVAVEKMFGVVEDFATVFFKMCHRVGDHGEVFLRSYIENLCDMQQPCLADDCDYRRLGLEEHAHLGIGLNRNAAATGATESGNAGVFPSELGRLGKKGCIARIRARPTAFDEIDPERIQFLSDANLVEDGKRNPRALGAVAQRGVVNGDRFHKRVTKLPSWQAGIKNAQTLRLTPLRRQHIIRPS